jgi:hypothetical protein
MDKSATEEDKYEARQHDMFDSPREQSDHVIRDAGSSEALRRTTTERAHEYDVFLQHQKDMTK